MRGLSQHKIEGNGLHRAQAVAQVVRTVGFTFNVKTEFQPGPSEPEDANAEYDHPDTVARIAQALRANGFRVEILGSSLQVMSRLERLAKVDIVFNIAEGRSGRNRESEVPTLLELLGVPFVGADALTQGMTLDKVMAKKALIADGIRTPRFIVVHDPGRIALRGLKFPLIAKPRCEGSSKGLSDNSVVHNLKQLREQATWLIRMYRQPVLVEEFIRGQEVTVAIVGNDRPEISEVVQIAIDGKTDLGDQFYTHSRLRPHSGLTYQVGRTPKRLEAKLKAIAWRSYQAVDCRDFGRVDMRIDQRGEPYVLEINPLPSLSGDDVFPLVARANGMTYNDILGKILLTGIERYGLLGLKPPRPHAALIRRVAEHGIESVREVLARPHAKLIVDAHVAHG